MKNAAAARTEHIDWLSLAVVAGVHVLAAAAFVPWLFSWTGVALCIAGFYVFGTLGINLCYHRLLSHRSFKCPPWLERTTAILGICCLQKSPGQFVALHRKHHQHSDTDEDPHSPLASFFWGHMGWIFEKPSKEELLKTSVQYAKDLYRQPFYQRLEKNLTWLWIYAAHAAGFFAAGCAAGLLLGEFSPLSALQFGSSVLVWGVFVRTVCVWHITWSVNSFGHVWGYRNYTTREDSRNNWVVALISNGEGWHNNHHADQRSAAHGHRWWEVDVTYATIAALQLVGLVWDVVQPLAHSQAGGWALINSEGERIAIEMRAHETAAADDAQVHVPTRRAA
jgi:stearoyl-CoA desaturase (delta-9 desaturase)